MRYALIAIILGTALALADSPAPPDDDDQAAQQVKTPTEVPDESR